MKFATKGEMFGKTREQVIRGGSHAVSRQRHPAFLAKYSGGVGVKTSLNGKAAENS